MNARQLDTLYRLLREAIDRGDRVTALIVGARIRRALGK